jgi:hypothetical protein
MGSAVFSALTVRNTATLSKIGNKLSSVLRQLLWMAILMARIAWRG